MVGGLKRLVERLFGAGASQALEEEQTDSEARIGQLKREFATHPTKGLTPARLYQILEAAEQGDLKAQHELFEDMEEKDAQIAADLGKRRQLAAELEWQIVPPDGASRVEKKAADQAAEVFAGLEVEDLILDLGTGIGHGWANLELTWERDGDLRYPGQPELRPHAWFRLHPDHQNCLMLRDLSATGAELWPLGWLQHRHRAKPGYVARSGLHRVLAWPYLFQNYALGDLAELLEIYGLPARIGKYPTNASEKDKGTLLRAVTSLGHSAAGIIPDGMKIEFLEAAQGRADLFQAMLSWCERAKAKAILGGTLTSGTGEGTNTNALGNVHERGQASLIRSDARQYAGAIGRDLLWPMAAINWGITDRRRAPRFFLDTGDQEDYKRLADTLPTFVDMGARVPLWWLHEKTKIPQAADGEEMLKRAAPKASPTALTAALRAVLPGAGLPTPELQIARLSQDAAPVVAELVDQVGKLLEEAQTLEEFRDRLLEAYPSMDPGKLGDLMASALSAATLAGRVDLLEQAGA